MTDLLVRLPGMVSDMSGEFIGTTPVPPTGDRIQLTDLEVIQRWSLAVRGASADRGEVVAALRADLVWLERGRPQPPQTRTESEPPPRPLVTKAPRKPATKVTTK